MRTGKLRGAMPGPTNKNRLLGLGFSAATVIIALLAVVEFVSIRQVQQEIHTLVNEEVVNDWSVQKAKALFLQHRFYEKAIFLNRDDRQKQAPYINQLARASEQMQPLLYELVPRLRQCPHLSEEIRAKSASLPELYNTYYSKLSSIIETGAAGERTTGADPDALNAQTVRAAAALESLIDEIAVQTRQMVKTAGTSAMERSSFWLHIACLFAPVGILIAILFAYILSAQQRQIAEAADNLRITFDAIGEAVIAADTSGRIRQMNPVAGELTGWAYESARGKKLTSVFHVVDVETGEIALDKVKTVLDKGRASVMDCEAVLLSADGSEYRIVYSASPILDRNDYVNGMVLVFRDVTDKHRMEEALKESEEKYRNILESIEDGFFEVDISGSFTFFNKSMKEILGYTEDEDLMGLNNREFMDKETAGKVFQTFNTVYRTLTPCKTFDWQLIRKDGTTCWVDTSVSPKKDAAGHIIGFRGTCRDVTQRKAAEEALRQSEEKYRTIFENTGSATCIVDTDGTILLANEKSEELTGLPVDAIINKRKWTEFVLKEDLDKMWQQHILRRNDRGKALKNYETRLIDSRNNIRYVYLTIDMIPGTDLSVASLLDITEHKKAEAEKIKAYQYIAQHEKHALVGKIAGKMAHDFNNILGAIMGSTELALLDCQDQKTQKTLELILNQTDRGKNLTRNLVAFAKDQEPRQTYFHISEKIDLVMDLMKKDLSGIEVVRRDDPGVPTLLADPGMIEHVLVNMIQNAIHATSKTPAPKISVSTACRDESVIVEIEDNGCGIPDAHIENIYDPSFTLKGSMDATGSYRAGIKGTGYGMANVKKYIEQHKGDISVSSGFGDGTRFTISLPVVRKALSEEEKQEIETTGQHTGRHILLVEDEPEIREIQHTLLTEAPCSHRVDTAANGKAALDLIERNSYDLVSLDYILPGEISGMDVYARIRRNGQTVPVLFISGNIEFIESLKELKQNDPLVDHISKPCKNKEYINSINRLLDTAQVTLV